MTIIIDRGVGGTGMDPPTFMSETFFLMPLALSMLIFKKKSPRSGVGKAIKLFIVKAYFL